MYFNCKKIKFIGIYYRPVTWILFYSNEAFYKRIKIITKLGVFWFEFLLKPRHSIIALDLNNLKC